METNQTEKEKLSRVVTGLEADAKCVTINPDNGKSALNKEAASKFNEQVEEKLDKYDKHFEKLTKAATELGEFNIEIYPIINNLLVKPYTENPFQKIVKTNSGIIVDLGGAKPEYKSHEDGKYHEEESFIHVGIVTEVGPETKWVKKDDIIMWTKPSEVPIPFYKQGLVMINENRVLSVINKNLSERFKNGK